MSDPGVPARPISSEERQRSVDRLCRHFASDHLETGEFERRLDLAYAARTTTELVALEEDLPALRQETAPAAEPSVPQAMASVDLSRSVQEREVIGAIMGGTERTGNWTPARNLRCFALMGGFSLDFRDATFASREVDVTLLAIMGGGEIIVPPGVRVESNGIAIMGGFGWSEPAHPASPEAPLIRINGFALMGGVEIKERLPGESEREAKKRLRAERKAKLAARSSAATD